MSYVDGSDEDGDYPSKNDTVYNYTSYSYDDSANSLGYAIVSGSAPRNYGQLDEPSCSIQEANLKARTASVFTDDSNKPYGSDDAKQQLDQAIQKFQTDLRADPGKYSLQCFGPPSTRPQEFWEKAPEFPFPEQEREEEGPEIPEKLPRDPFARSVKWIDWRTRLILEIFEKAEEE